jgi:signal transduction histidine kinase/GNAT superfamily N-acetyltransferase
MQEILADKGENAIEPLATPSTGESIGRNGRTHPQSRLFSLGMAAAWLAIFLLWASWLAGALLYVRLIFTNLDVIYNWHDVLTGEAIRAASAGLGISPAIYAWMVFGMELALVMTFGVAGVILFWHKRDGFGAFLGVSLVLIATRISGPVTFTLYSEWPVLERPFNFLSGLAFVAFGALLYLFPDGRFVPTWTRWLLPLIALQMVWAVTGMPAQLGTVFALIYLGIGLGAQAYRYRRLSDPVTRRHVRWIIASFAAFVGIIVVGHLMAPNALMPTRPPSPQDLLVMLIIGPAITAVSITFIMALAVAILRDGLYNLDIFINRALVYGGLTLLITAVYILLVGGVGLLAGRGSIMVGLLVATVLVGVGVQPLHRRWQTAVNRLIPLPIISPSTPPTTRNNEEQLPVRQQRRIWISLGTAVLLAIGLLWQGLSLDIDNLLFTLSASLAYLIVGSVILMRQPHNRVGWLCTFIGLIMLLVASTGVIQARLLLWPAVTPYQLAFIPWLRHLLHPLMVIPIFVYLPLLFPNGQFLTPRWRQFSQIIVLLLALFIILMLVRPGPMLDIGGDWQLTYDNPLVLPLPILNALPTVHTLDEIASFVVLIASLISIGSLVLRWRRSEGEIRQQIKWVVYFLAIVFPLFILVELFVTLFPTARGSTAEMLYLIVVAVTWIGFPVVIGLAILYARLYDIDMVMNRTLVYGGLTAVILAIYILAVGGLSLLFQSQNNLLISLLATGLIAVFFQPIRDRLQRGANRLIYGDRDDPYKVLSQLGRQLRETAVPGQTLTAITATLCQTLKLPYAAVALHTAAGERHTAAATGQPSTVVEEWQLLYQAELVGWLIVAPRSPQERFTERERRLLADIAAQAGTAAYAERLTSALQRSRERLVLAREEERRRIRRDLHDELGPSLAGQTFALDTALDLLETDPLAAAPLLASLKSQNQALIADIRRLVYALRPPSLDELGLLAALKVHISQLAPGNNGLQVKVTAVPDPLPPLPAAVEVAAYRIALEAITNVVRHAQARQANIWLAVAPASLSLTISDDGVGLPTAVRPGVGLASMRERAEELGGTFYVESAPGGGTSITAIMPLMEIKAALPDQLPLVMDILAEAAAWLAAKGINQWPSPPNEAWWRRMEQQLSNGEVYLAYLSGEAVGTLRLLWTDSYWPDDETAGYVHSLAIRNRVHGLKIGAALLNWAMEESRRQGKQLVRLDCGVSNGEPEAASGRLRRYYEELGFVYCGEVQDYDYTAVLYEKKL